MLTRKNIKTTLLIIVVTYPISCHVCATPPPPIEAPPLLEKLRALHCSSDSSSAKEALDELWNAHNNDFLFPDEWMNDEKKNSRLYAGSMDIALDVFVDTIKKFPSLQRQVERTFLQWNYCEVFRNGKFYDLSIVDGEIQKEDANYTPPLYWSGFKRLGFLSEKATYIPELLIRSPIGERAFENFFHKIYRNRCFPHPVTGEMFYVKRRTSPTHLKKPVKEPKNTRYPYIWNKKCTSEVVAVETTPLIFEDKKEPNLVIELKEKAVEIIPTVPKVEVAKTTPEEKPELTQSKPVITQEVATEAEATPETEPTPAPELRAGLLSNEMHNSYRQTYDDGYVGQHFNAATSEEVFDSLLSSNEIYEASGDIANNSLAKGPTLDVSVFDNKPNVVLPSVPSGNIPSNSPAALLPRMVSKSPKESSGFSGGVYLSHGLGSHSTSIGGALSWTPIKDSYWNIRVGGNYSLDAKEDPFSYSWGLGYSDWHPGTVSYQLNHYGPIKPGEGLAIDKAVGNIGYSVKSKTLDKLKLGLSGSIDIPVKGDPALNAGLQWSPKESWFIRAGINQPLNGGDPSWSYGFGYSNWRPNKINIAYSNYGPNALFDDNFKKNGSITISYNWEF
ncbi:MAG: Unknown protein [uncultured Thiotrichaceae bacterium]|uniref:Uncharacterized protein n=1 Tax=uncultured Thiotrichaceae bacterium TaxID=298394 RepID=A0A6S6TIC7_9GAMM|nr:MAG: Unknown protein [uncultured Thiotrichaceae bacterium]